MNRLEKCGAAFVAAAVLFMGQNAAAELRCGSPVTRAAVVPCALKASYAIAAQRDELDAASARKVAVSPLLPANPTLTILGAHRSAGDQKTVNWYATLAQEIEIGGQRGLRRDSAEADVAAQRQVIVALQRDVAAEALVAFYEALAAREETLLAERMTAATKAVSRVARAKADKGLIAPVDADVAAAVTVRVLRVQLAAERRAGAALGRLATLMGEDPARSPFEVQGDLEPPPGVDALGRSVAGAEPVDRPEFQALEAQRRAMEFRASAFRRSRVPNPTLSAFAENDGFSEHVFGLGIAFPIPIPGNVGRTYNGEVAESEALARRATSELERVKREYRLATTVAARAFESRRREVAAFTPELLKNSETSLRALALEVENGRLTVREAVVAQESLIELLQGYVAARRDWCLTSVELARAAGMPLERGTP